MPDKSEIGLAGCLVALLAAIPLSIYWGWAIQHSWGWFVVPVFDAPHLPLAAAIGISGLLSMQTSRGQKSENAQGVAEALVESAMRPTMLLVVGWIVQHWMPT